MKNPNQIKIKNILMKNPNQILKKNFKILQENPPNFYENKQKFT